MFVLLEKTKRTVLYIRAIPKDSELFDEVRGSNFSHWILLSFFYDHNNKKSILISNPNANEITDSSEIAPISSYLEKNSDVQVYHTGDYLQLDNNFCGPGSLIALRALYNMNDDSFKKILQNGQQKNMGDSGLKYISIELGYNALQEVIGKVPRLAITKTPQTHEGEKVSDKVNPLREEIAQVLRKADYDTSEGKKNRDKEVEELTKRMGKKYSKLYKKEASTLTGELIKELKKKDPELLSMLKGQQAGLEESGKRQASHFTYGNAKSETVNHQQLQQEKGTAYGKYRNNTNNKYYIIVSSTVLLSLGIAYLAGAATLTPLSAAVTTFIVSVAVGALIGYGIGRFCEKVSEEKQNNPDKRTSDAVKSVFSNTFITNGHSESKSFT